MDKGEIILNLRKNWYTYVFGGLFIILLLYACCRAAQWAIYLSTSQTSITGILIFCVILFIVLSYFIKEGEFLSFFQENRLSLWIIEILLLAVLVGFFIYSMTNTDVKELGMCAFLICSSYLLGRLCGGRLAGMASLVFSYFLVSQIVIQVATADQMLTLSVFMGAAILSICVVKFADLAKSYAMQIVIYSMLAVLLAMATLTNPLIVLLLVGLILSLLFSSPRGGMKSLTLVIAFVATLFIMHFIVALGSHLDVTQTVLLDTYISPFKRSVDPAFTMNKGIIALLNSILEKYEDVVFTLYVPFANGVLPTILLFLCGVAGFFSLKRRESYIYPIMYTFIAILGVYITFSEQGSDLIYLYTVLPVFAGYAFEQFLIPPVTVKEKSEVIKREANKASTAPVSAPVLSEEKQASVPSLDVKNPAVAPALEVEKPAVAPSLALEEPVVAPTFVEKEPIQATPVNRGSSVAANEDEFADLFNFNSNNHEPNMTKTTSNNDVSGLKVEDDLGLKINPQPIDEPLQDTISSENTASDDYQFNNIKSDEPDINELLSRLGVQENIERMNNAKREDMAEWIEKSPQSEEMKEAKRVINESELIIPEVSKEEQEPEITWEDEYKAPPVLHFNHQKSNITPKIMTPKNMYQQSEQKVQRSQPASTPEPVVRKFGVGNRSYVSMKLNNSKKEQ